MSRNSAGSSNQSHFSRIPAVNTPRSVFNRDHTHKTTMDTGLLYPFLVQEILPGDTLKLSTNVLARLATPIFPYMDNVYMDTHYFFIPNRLVWENWERFNGAQDDPGDSTDFLVPQLDDATHSAGFAELSIYDFMGLPTKVASVPQDDMPMALPLRAYNLVWNEWYRDENLQNSVDVPKGDGPDTTAYDLLRRGRRKDYFTSAIPWPQKGPSVLLPIGATAPVVSVPSSPTVPVMRYQGTQTLAPERALETRPTTAELESNTNSLFYIDPNGSLYADLSEATASTINDIRQAATLQQLFERDARGGTRYVELLLSHFGVVSPDFRLQRPEYLGGGTTNVNVNPVSQTSSTDSETPQGNLAAFATANGRHGFNHSFVEHGFVLGLISFRAETTYQQGLNRMWSRRTRFDYYWPDLAHLGEQTVLNKEIYMQGPVTPPAKGDNDVFGYQERFAEYRYQPSMVTGRFRSNSTVPLDSWHLALDFDTLPTLAGLIPENPPMERIIAVDSEPDWIVDTYTRMRHARAMPTYSVPGLTRF